MMTTNQKIEAIIATAQANNVDLHRNFTASYLSQHTCYDGPQRVANDAIDGMWKMCGYGVNGDFDAKLRSTIGQLSKIVIELTDVYNNDVKKLGKAENSCNKALASIRPADYAPKVDASKAVKEYVKNSMQAIDTVIEFHGDGDIFATVDEKQIEQLKKSKEKFGEMLERLGDVFDVSSTAAADKAERIIDDIEAWRDDCLAFMCTSASLARLSSAQALLDEWVNQKNAVVRKTRAKSVPEYDGGDLAVLATSKNAFEIISAFNSRVESEKRSIALDREKLDQARRRYDEIEDQIAALEGEKKQVAIQLKNDGDAVKANRAFTQIKEKIALLDNEADRIYGDGELEDKEEVIKNREDILDNVMSVYKLLDDNKNDVVFLSEAVEEVDFNELVRVMSGSVNADYQSALDSIRTIRTYSQLKLEQIAEARAKTKREREIAGKAFGRNKNPEERRRPRTRANADELDPELAALMASLEGEEKKEESDEVKVKDPRKIVHIGDDK